MKRFLAPALMLWVLAAPASAKDSAAVRTSRDSARAQERQARAIEAMREFERDWARETERTRINAQRDARSMRRFDR